MTPSRLAGLLLLGMLVCDLARADDAEDRLFALALGCEYKNGALEIDPYPETFVWLNGVEQDTHYDNPRFMMKPGDVAIIQSPMLWESPEGPPSKLPPGDFYRYRLDQLGPRTAVFTLTAFAAGPVINGTASRRYYFGCQLSSSRFKLDLRQPHFVFGYDSDSYVETRSGKAPYRSK
jgi:hypothetical protein